MHDLIAHLVAVPADIAAGKLTSIPSPAQTQAQVDERPGRGVPALLEEWDQGLGPIVEATRAGLLGLRGRLKEGGLAPLRLRDPDAGFDVTAGKGDPAVTVTAPVFELFRAIAGRRSREQVAGYAWEGDSGPYLDAFCIFGSRREQDLYDA